MKIDELKMCCNDSEIDCIGCEIGKDNECADCCRDWGNEEEKL